MSLGHWTTTTSEPEKVAPSGTTNSLVSSLLSKAQEATFPTTFAMPALTPQIPEPSEQEFRISESQQVDRKPTLALGTRSYVDEASVNVHIEDIEVNDIDSTSQPESISFSSAAPGSSFTPTMKIGHNMSTGGPVLGKEDAPVPTEETSFRTAAVDEASAAPVAETIAPAHTFAPARSENVLLAKESNAEAKALPEVITMPKQPEVQEKLALAPVAPVVEKQAPATPAAAVADDTEAAASNGARAAQGVGEAVPTPAVGLEAQAPAAPVMAPTAPVVEEAAATPAAIVALAAPVSQEKEAQAEPEAPYAPV